MSEDEVPQGTPIDNHEGSLHQNGVRDLVNYQTLENFKLERVMSEASNGTHMDALVNVRNDKRGTMARKIPFKLIAKEYTEEKINFASEMIFSDSLVKPFVCLTSDEELNDRYFDDILYWMHVGCPDLSNDFDKIVILRLRRSEYSESVVSKKKKKFEYRIIWNCGIHFASLLDLKEFLKPNLREMEEKRCDPYVYRIETDLACVGSGYRWEWHEDKDKYPFGARPRFTVVHPEDEQDRLDEYGVRACCVTAIQENSRQILVDRPVSRNFVPVARGRDPVIEAAINRVQSWNNARVELDGDPIRLDQRRLQLEFRCPGYTGIKCKNREHSSGFIRMMIKDQIAEVHCCETPRGERCDYYSISLSADPKVEAKRRWKATYQFIVDNNLDRIDFPLLLDTWGRHGINPREFYMERGFDFDNDFGEHPTTNVEASFPFDAEMVQRFSQTGMEDAFVRYVNLFLCVNGRDGTIIMRHFDTSMYDIYTENKLKIVLKPLKYWVEQFTPAGKEKPPKQMEFYPFWLAHQKRRMFLSFNKTRLKMDLSFQYSKPNLIVPPTTNRFACVDAWNAVSEADKDFLRAVLVRYVHCMTALESDINRVAMSDWFLRWLTYMLFEVGVHHAISLFVFSPDGGTGKSSLAGFIKIHHGDHQTRTVPLTTLLHKHFNVEFNRALINCDDTADIPADPAKASATIGLLKNFITDPNMVMAEKQGKEHISEPKIANLLSSGNKIIEFVNPSEHERRHIMLEILGAAAQMEYFQGEGAYECRHCEGRCHHNFSTMDQFWKQIWNTDISDSSNQVAGQYFYEFVGMLYLEYYLVLKEQDETPLFLMAPDCRLVKETQESMATLEELWYEGVVRRGYVINCDDPFPFKSKGLMLCDGIDPNVHKRKWIDRLPIDVLWQDFLGFAKDEPNRIRPSRVAFTSRIVAMMGQRAPKGNFGLKSEMLDCKTWVYDQASKMWNEGDTIHHLECLRLYKVKKPARLASKKIKINRTFKKSTSNAAFGENSFSGFYNSRGSLSDSLPESLHSEGSMEMGGYEPRFVENEEGDGIGDHGEVIDRNEPNSAEWEEEPNEDDEQFIDNSQQPVRKRGREELSQAQDEFVEKTQKMDDDDDANEALSLELELE